MFRVRTLIQSETVSHQLNYQKITVIICVSTLIHKPIEINMT